MNEHPHVAPPAILVTASEIAEIAQVGPSAVSNWRRRHSDFPAEVEPGLFDRAEVVAWLRANDRNAVVSDEPVSTAALWGAADLIRRSAKPDEALELMLQLLVLRAASVAPRESILQPLGGVWGELQQSAEQPNALIEVIGRASATRPEWALAFRPPSRESSLGSHDWSTVIQYFEKLPASSDWGRLASMLVERYLDGFGAARGDFSSTPGTVAVMRTVLQPLVGRVYDPACGAAQFLAESWREQSTAISHLYGQEVNQRSWRLGYLRLLAHGADFSLALGDTLQNDQFWDLRADRIAIEPPFGVRVSSEQVQGDPRWLTQPLPGRAEWLWTQHARYHLAEEGTAAIAVPAAVLETLDRAGIAIVQDLLNRRQLEAIIEMPPGVFPASALAGALVVLRGSGRAVRDDTLMIDARQLGEAEKGKPRTFSEADLGRIAEELKLWRVGDAWAPTNGFSGRAHAGDIVRENFDLMPHRFVQYARPASEIEGEPVERRFGRLFVEFKRSKQPTSPWSIVLSDLDRLNELLAERHHVGRVRLGDLLIVDPVAGVRRADDAGGEETPWISTSIVSSGADSIADRPTEFTTVDPRGKTTQNGDLLLVSRGVERNTSAPCATVRLSEPCAFSESLIRLRIDSSRADPDFVRLFLSSRAGTSALSAAATGSVISNLQRSALAAVEIPLPNLDTQRRIAEELKGIEQNIALTVSTLARLRDLHDTAREKWIGDLLAQTEPSSGWQWSSTGRRRDTGADQKGDQYE